MSKKSIGSLALSQNKVNYLLGIDGGGTKTEFLLTDLNGKEIKRVILGASNPVNIGIENTEKILEQGISQICGDIDYSEISVFAGLAGGISGGNKAIINKFLSGFGFGAFDNAGDTDNALEIALKGGNGVTVIMGTGIIAFSQLDGVRRRIGGWGYLIDKGGSGFSYGSEALNSALRYHDGRGGSSILLQLIEAELGKSLTDSVPDIYQGGAAYVASFAPIVFAAYKKGDKEAERIIDLNSKEVARIIRTGCEFLNGKSGKIVLCGGMCRQQEILKPFLLKYLGGEYPLIFSTEPMVNGAVSLAKFNTDKCGGKIC